MKRIIILLFLMGMTSCKSLNIQEKINNNKQQVLHSILLDDSSTLRRYLNDDFPVNYIDIEGNSLVKKAVYNGSEKCLNLLINKGASLELKDFQGRTPIFYVRDIKILEILLESGADTNIVDDNQESLLSYFIKTKPYIYVDKLVKKGVDYYLLETDNWNSLFWSVLSYNTEFVDLLIENNANYQIKDCYGNYPISYSINEEITLKLLESGNYNLNDTNLKGENILGELYLKSVALGQKKVFDKLLEMGVNPNYSSYNENALDIAKKYDKLEMIEYIKKLKVK